MQKIAHIKTMPTKGSKRKESALQSTLQSPKYPLVKDKGSHYGKQIKVLGSHWDGRMSAEEKKTAYLCTVLDFDVMHKMPGKTTPEQEFKVQEMGEAGTGSLEKGDASGETFWIAYPMPYLEFYYKTFPLELPWEHPGRVAAIGDATPTPTAALAFALALTLALALTPEICAKFTGADNLPTTCSTSAP